MYIMPSGAENGRCKKGTTKVRGTNTCMTTCPKGTSRKKGNIKECTPVGKPRGRQVRKKPTLARVFQPHAGKQHIHELD